MRHQFRNIDNRFIQAERKAEQTTVQARPTFLKNFASPTKKHQL